MLHTLQCIHFWWPVTLTLPLTRLWTLPFFKQMLKCWDYACLHYTCVKHDVLMKYITCCDGNRLSMTLTLLCLWNLPFFQQILTFALFWWLLIQAHCGIIPHLLVYYKISWFKKYLNWPSPWYLPFHQQILFLFFALI